MLNSATTRAIASTLAIAMLAGCNVFRTVPTVETASFRLSESTWTNVDVSLNGRSIVFDLLGDIYLVPAVGGKAKALLEDEHWTTQPAFLPSGREIAFLSDQGGTANVWILNLDTLEKEQVTQEDEFFIGSFRWSSAGSFVADVFDSRNGRSVGTLLGSSSGTDQGFLSGAPSTWTSSSIGSSGNDIYIAARVESLGLRILHRDVQETDTFSRIRTICDDEAALSTEVCEVFNPVPSLSGRLLSYMVYKPEGLFLVLRNMELGTDQILATISSLPRLYQADQSKKLYPNTAFSPDERYLYFWASGRIQRVEIDTQEVANVDWMTMKSFRSRAPTSSPPRKSIDRMDHVRWAHRVPGSDDIVYESLGIINRYRNYSRSSQSLTDSGSRAYSPSVSPDGRNLAYVTWSDNKAGDIAVQNLESGSITRLGGPGRFYASPAWSSDGRYLAFYASDGHMRNAVGYEYSSLTLVVCDLYSKSSSCQTLTTKNGVRIGNRRTIPPITFDSDSTGVYVQGIKQNDRIVEWVSLADPKHRELLFSFPVQIDYAAISPNGESVALIGRFHIFIQDMESLRANASIAPRVSSLNYRKRLDVAANYVHWINDGLLAWSTKSDFKVYDLANSNLSSTRIHTPQQDSNRSRALNISGTKIVDFESNSVKHVGLTLSGSLIESTDASRNLHGDVTTYEIDLSQKYVIPGIIDTHLHLHHFENSEYFVEQPRQHLSSLRYGITTLFDPAAPSLDVLVLERYVDAGTIWGPRIFSTGRPFFGFDYLPEYVNLTSADETDQILRQFTALGFDYLKSYMYPSRRDRRLLAQRSERMGLLVSLESQRREGLLLQGIDDSVSSIEHYSAINPIYDDHIKFIAQSGVTITPTLLVSPQWRGERIGVVHNFCNFRPSSTDRKYYEKSIAILQQKRPVTGCPFEEDLVFLRAAENVVKIARAGGNISIGSHALPGLGAHWELWMLVEAGADPIEAIRIATLGGAKKLGLEDELGTIEEGKLADFLVLRCNPLENIRCTADIEYVVKNGFVWHADSMTQMWPEYKPLPKPWWHSDEDWEELKPELPEPWEGVPIADGVELEQRTIH